MMRSTVCPFPTAVVICSLADISRQPRVQRPYLSLTCREPAGKHFTSFGTITVNQFYSTKRCGGRLNPTVHQSKQLKASQFKRQEHFTLST
jgi:hypothetical protein